MSNCPKSENEFVSSVKKLGLSALIIAGVVGLKLAAA
jgi:hypothetical protein